MDNLNSCDWLSKTFLDEDCANLGSKFLVKEHRGYFVDRYYKSYFIVNYNDIQNNDYVVYQHSNGVCVLCFAETHFIHSKSSGYKIMDISFQVSKNVNLSFSKVKGKRKRGGHIFNCPSSVVAKIVCENDIEIPVHCIIPGRLFEVNSGIYGDINSPRKTPSYIAIIMPKLPSGKYLKEIKNRPEFEESFNALDSPNIPFPLCIPGIPYLTKEKYMNLCK